MLTLAQIRKELQEVRYYYSRKENFDSCEMFEQNSILALIQKYNNALVSAPIRLCDIYLSLHIQDRTQEALAHELGFAVDEDDCPDAFHGFTVPFFSAGFVFKAVKQSCHLVT